MKKQVMLAPVPCVHLASAKSIPKLAERVAFGTNKVSLEKTFPIGIPVYIYVSDSSQPRHLLFRRGFATWAGTLGAIVKAEEQGKRSGRHPDASVRPPSAEEGDTPAIEFWEVLGLHQLKDPRPLSFFTKDGKKPFDGDAPRWPVLVEIDD